MLASVDTTYGAVLVGLTVAAVLYGVMCAQTARYFTQRNEDKRAFKTVIGVLWAVDTAQIVSVAYSLYFYLITGRTVEVPGPGVVRVWTYPVVIIVSNISDFLVHGILLHRIFHLSGRQTPLLIVFGIVIAVAAAAGITYGVIAPSPGRVTQYPTKTWLIYFVFSTSAAADILFSFTLCVYFSRMRSDVKSAYTLMNRLIMYNVYAGCFPSAVALLSVLTYALFPDTFIYITFFCVLPQALLNSMLAMLNARPKLRHYLPHAKFSTSQLQDTLSSMEDVSLEFL